MFQQLARYHGRSSDGQSGSNQRNFLVVLCSPDDYSIVPLGLGLLGNKPGPGFLFFWVNIVLGIMSLVVLIRAWAGKKGEGPQPAIFWLRQNIPKIIFVLISLFLYALLMETVGFIPVTLLLFIFLLGDHREEEMVFYGLCEYCGDGDFLLIFEICFSPSYRRGCWIF